ncbi:MAG: TldD/PmbA family protein [Chitinophagaceae bacterium]|nr:MAG: TldD/PmbA family protein [Chitinophagaceae bacterium]
MNFPAGSENVTTLPLASAVGTKIASADTEPVFTVVFAGTSTTCDAPDKIPVAKSKFAFVFKPANATVKSFKLATPVPFFTINSTLANWCVKTKFAVVLVLLKPIALFAYNKSTNVSFNVTLRTEDGKGSGYATKAYNDFKKLNTKTDTAIAAKKALASVTAKAIEPGKYTVILEPTAVAVMLENLFFDMDARQADEGRSSMSKPGGKTKVGEQLLDERVNIYSDPWNAELPTSTWSGDGRPQQKINWIEKGVVKNLYSSRYWAEKTGIKSIPTPDGAIMQGGTKTLEELIKGTEKGILVTRLWYIRSVDPQTLLLTGLTRDGTFYIENGEIKFPVKNFRFNESPIIMLNNLEEIGKSERTVSAESDASYLLPPLKIKEFTFTSLSDAV